MRLAALTPVHATIADAVVDRPGIELADLDRCAALQTRIDRKYLLSGDAAARFVRALPEGTRVLDIEGRRGFRYASTYYDTPALDSFLDAAHRRARRGKVRTRTYLDSGLRFLEVKTRRRGATVKSRTPWDGGDLTSAASDFIVDRLAEGGVSLRARLDAVLEADYTRTTLVLPDAEARVTLDSRLRWRLAAGGGEYWFDGQVVVETKSGSHPSGADKLLWRTGHRPTGISKYATGLAVLRPDLPRNRWHRLLSALGA